MRTAPHLRAAALALLLVPWLDAAPLQSVYGLIETLDGQSWVGEVRFESGALTIVATNGASHRAGFDTLARFQPQERPKIIPPERGLRATYFGNRQLEGPGVSRLDPTVDFDWGEASPAKDIPADNFSVRWLGRLEAPAEGEYKLFVESDDGVRLWIDNFLLIDQWHDQSRVEHEGSITLDAGRKHDLKLEFYEAGGGALARLQWIEPGQAKTVIPEARLSPPPPPPPSPGSTNAPAGTNGLLALYFNTQDLTGPSLAVTNPTINFEWKDRPPLPGINSDHFSVRWMGQIIPAATAIYTFHAESDDGMRLWVDRDLLIKAWNDGAFSLTSQPVPMVKDRAYELRFEMYDASAGAMARLSWSTPSQGRAVIPTQQLIPAPVAKSSPGSDSQPAGVLLTSGSFIARRVHEADSSQIRFSASPSAPTLSAIHAARVNFHRLTPDKAATLQPGRAGLLLQSGDFVDGEVRAIREDKVLVHSVLFGLKRFGMDTALAAVWRDARTNAAPFEIRTRDQSLFLAEHPRLDNNSLGFLDGALATFKIAPEDLLEIRRATKENQKRP